jgi:hypothetical protein
MSVKGIDKLVKLTRTIKQIPKESEKAADLSIVFNSPELLALNRAQLKVRGIDADGKVLRYLHPRKTTVSGVYTAAYDRFKSKKGKQTNFIDLNLSGDTLNSLYLDHKRVGVFKIMVRKNGFDIQKELEWNYGNEIFGVTEQSMQRFSDRYIKPSVDERIQTLIDKI